MGKRFGVGEMVVYVDNDGVEHEVAVQGHDQMGTPMCMVDGVLRSLPEPLLRPKGAYFDVRGKVMTDNPKYFDETGEIIATGTGPKRDGQPAKRFFKVKYRGESEGTWFNEDQVFIPDDDAESKSDVATDVRIAFWS